MAQEQGITADNGEVWVRRGADKQVYTVPAATATAEFARTGNDRSTAWKDLRYATEAEITAAAAPAGEELPAEPSQQKEAGAGDAGGKSTLTGLNKAALINIYNDEIGVAPAGGLTNDELRAAIEAKRAN